MDAAEVRRLMDQAKTPLDKLRVPFAENQIGLLPRTISKGDSNRAECRSGTVASADGRFCGGYHPRSIHLDFVGHAALTDRLLEVDPEWTWRPLATDDYGLPKFDQFGGLWIELTVAGVSRLGYGDAQGKPAGSTAVKEVIGDALRNAGMRFGMALDLWHKGDLHDFAEEQGSPSAEPAGARTASRAPRRQTVAAPAAPAAPSGPKTFEVDWLTEAVSAPTAADVRAIYRRAKADGAPEAMLSSIEAHGKKLADQEKAAAEAALPDASEALRQGFEGGNPS